MNIDASNVIQLLLTGFVSYLLSQYLKKNENNADKIIELDKRITKIEMKEELTSGKK